MSHVDWMSSWFSTGVPHRLWLFVWGEKRSPHKTYGGPYPRSRLQSMFVLVLLSTIFWYVGPLKETKAKVTFLLILHPLRINTTVRTPSTKLTFSQLNLQIYPGTVQYRTVHFFLCIRYCTILYSMWSLFNIQFKNYQVELESSLLTEGRLLSTACL